MTENYSNSALGVGVHKVNENRGELNGRLNCPTTTVLSKGGEDYMYEVCKEGRINKIIYTKNEENEVIRVLSKSSFMDRSEFLVDILIGDDSSEIITYNGQSYNHHYYVKSDGKWKLISISDIILSAALYETMLDSNFNDVEKIELLGSLKVSIKCKGSVADIYTIDTNNKVVTRMGEDKWDNGSLSMYNLFLQDLDEKGN